MNMGCQCGEDEYYADIFISRELNFLAICVPSFILGLQVTHFSLSLFCKQVPWGLRQSKW